MGLSTMRSGDLDSHNLGDVIREIMLARDVSKSQQCPTEKAPVIAAPRHSRSRSSEESSLDQKEIAPLG